MVRVRHSEDGKIVKENDHLMDATRYLIVSGIDRMTTEVQEEEEEQYEWPYTRSGSNTSWMAS